MTIQGDIHGRVGNTSAIVGDTLKRFVPELKKKYSGVRVGFEGQNKETEITQQSMAFSFILGLIGIILSYMLMGLDIPMSSMLGFVSLAGVVVKSSFLLVNFAKDNYDNGMPLQETVRRASRAGFRAMLLIITTTMAALLPILMETNPQAQVFTPLVNCLSFGLLSSTILVPFIVPSLYLIFDDMGLTTVVQDKRAATASSDAAE